MVAKQGNMVFANRVLVRQLGHCVSIIPTPGFLCGNALEGGAERNELFCKTCQSAMTVPNKKERLCKNAAAGDNPCSNDSCSWLINDIMACVFRVVRHRNHC